MTRVRGLFLNQGQALPGTAMGHLSAHAHLQAFMPDRVHADYRTLEPFGTWQRRIALRRATLLPGNGWVRYRWYLGRSFIAERVVKQHMRTTRTDFVHVTSNDIAYRLHRIDVPCAISVDVTLRNWLHLLDPWGIDSADLGVISRERHAFDRAAMTIAWTHHIAQAVRNESADARIEVLHPGVDLTRFTRRTGAREAGPIRVLFVGGRFASKGGPALIDAAQRLGNGIELHLVTPEPVRARPNVTVHRAGAGSRELVELFQRADLFALPTRVDAVPWVIVEAMASGVPVLSTNIESIPELIGPDAGVVVDPDSPDQLLAALAELTDDPRRLVEMGAAGRERAERCYDAAVNTARLADLMCEMTGR